VITTPSHTGNKKRIHLRRKVPFSTFKGIVPPKMKVLSSITLPKVVPNPYAFLSSAEHKRRYFEEYGQPNS